MSDAKLPYPETYTNRLNNYLRWATMDSVGTSGTTKAVCAGQAADGLSPEEVMFRFETKGESTHKCTDLSRLCRYLAGKNTRDFYVSNWVKDVSDGLFVAEEFVCTGGMDLEEFRKVFKRNADPWLLRRMWRDEGREAAATTPVQPAVDLAEEIEQLEMAVCVRFSSFGAREIIQFLREHWKARAERRTNPAAGGADAD